MKRIGRKLHKIRNKYPDDHLHLPGYQQLQLEYKSYMKYKTQIIRIAKKQYNIQINNFLQNSKFDDKRSWRIIKSNYKTPHNDIPPLNVNDTILINPIDKAEILHTTLANPLPPKLNNKHKQFQRKINQIIDNIQIQPNNQNLLDILNTKIQLYELKTCIQNLNHDKACGPDQIHNVL